MAGRDPSHKVGGDVPPQLHPKQYSVGREAGEQVSVAQGTHQSAQQSPHPQFADTGALRNLIGQKVCRVFHL